MAIKPKCNRCGKELQKFGGILLSPPDRKGMVRKYHLCKGCFEAMARKLGNA